VLGFAFACHLRQKEPSVLFATGQLINVYNQDAQLADSMLSSGQAAIAKLKAELEVVRQESTPELAHSSSERPPQETHRLLRAVEAAAAVLRAVVTDPSEDQLSDDDGPEFPTLRRARSECATRGTISKAVKPALSRTPRTSGVRRRVSFGDDDVKSFRGSDDIQDGSPKSITGEPEPEEGLLRQEPSFAADYGLMELCVPSGEPKVGFALKEFPPAPLVIRKVSEHSWAETQGIRVGDVVIAVAGRRAETLTAEQFMRFMQARPLRLIVERLPPSSDN
jgi:hypothetical protein